MLLGTVTGQRRGAAGQKEAVLGASRGSTKEGARCLRRTGRARVGLREGVRVGRSRACECAHGEGDTGPQSPR